MIREFSLLLCTAVIVALSLVAMPVSAIAVKPEEVLSDAGLEKRARALSAGLRCVVCQNQSIDDSDAPLAGDLRRLVRERLVAGDSDEEVMDNVVARYGEFVLLKPRFGVHTAILWLMPFVVLGLALCVMLRARRRRAVAVGGRKDAAAAPLSDEEEQRLAALLKGHRGTSVSKD